MAGGCYLKITFEPVVLKSIVLRYVESFSANIFNSRVMVGSKVGSRPKVWNVRGKHLHHKLCYQGDEETNLQYIP